MNVVNGIDTKQSQNYPISQALETIVIPGWLSHAEKNFIKVLNSVIANDAFIFVKVKVNDVLRNIHVNDEYNEEYDFGNKTFDYVLCDKQDLTVKCVIELDDRPHAFQKMYPEYSYDSMCSKLGIPLLEVPARCGYNHVELRSYVAPFLNLAN